MSAELFLPHEVGSDPKLPTILLCNGWGGLRTQLAPWATWFAAHGFVAATFDYRGWGDSDGKVIPTGDTPRLVNAGVTTIPVRVIRELMDPPDQALDIRNAIDYLMGEPCVDPSRIGLWGTSMGGGHAVWTAAHDSRVRCVVAQVGGFGPPRTDEARSLCQTRATEKARGELDPAVPQGIDQIPGPFAGTPDFAKIWWYRPMDFAKDVSVPTLIIDAENEELMDIAENGRAVYEIVASNVPAQYQTYPCDHYGIYDEYYRPAVDLALEWFRSHL